MRKFASIIALSGFALALAACGDSGNGDLSGGSGSTSSSGGTGSTTGNGGTTTTVPVYSMGNGTGSAFQTGMIGVSSSSLSAGGSASLSITIVDQTGVLDATSAGISVTINSPCIAAGQATVTLDGTAITSVTTNSGEVDVVYTAKGCTGSDVITATATVGSQTLSATGSVTVAAASIGSLQFLSATPSTIGLKGTGLNETSAVVFKVVDSSGGPRPGVTVTFALNTTVGGLTIAPMSATSAQDGTVQTVVSSGTQHTAVRVTATIASPALSTQSSVLTVTTGLPASAAFSLAVGPPSYSPSGLACSNIEAYNTDLVTASFTTQLADRYGNPAPDGTAAAFTTDAGHIVGNCTTPLATAGDGECKVTWTSANPRPSPSTSPPSLANGRGMVLATAIGEESFDDVNGNGYWDAGEPFTDLGEPYRDDNENAKYDLGEYFLDFNQNGVRDGPSGVFRGITCTGSTAGSTCTSTTLAIGVAHRIIMSTGGAIITPVTYSNSVAPGASQTFTVAISDLNGNAMPAGTTVAFSATSSVGTTSQPQSPYIMGCDETAYASGGGAMYSATFTAATPASPTSGTVNVTVTSPLGTITSLTFQVAVQ